MRTIDWHGESLMLLPDRAVFWPRCKAIIVADLHLGKAAAFRAAGIPVPEVIHTDLDRLSRLLDEHSAERLVIAGDLLHARSGRTDAVLRALSTWRESRRDARITVVRGNHDAHAGDLPLDLGFECVDGPFALHDHDPIAIGHDPEVTDDHGRAVICGHLHPSITLGDGCTSVRAAIFWVRPNELVLPAFGRFTGCRDIRPQRGDRVFAVGEGSVLEVGGERPLARAGSFS